MGEELLTLKQVAEKLDLPESTLRKYRDAYTKYIPFVGSGRERKYRVESVDVFGMIRDCRSEKHLSWEDTEKELGKQFPVMDPGGVVSEASLQEERIGELFDHLEEMMNRVDKMGRRQEFLLTSLAGELVKVSSAIDLIKTMSEDMKAINKSTFDYNIVVQSQQKQSNQNTRTLIEAMGALLEGLSGIEGGISGLEGVVKKQLVSLGKALIKEIKANRHVEKAPEKPVEPAPDMSAIFKLKEELLDARVELGKYRNLYERSREELDKMKGRRQSLEQQVFSEPIGMQPEKASPPGGKLLVRGRKK